MHPICRQPDGSFPGDRSGLDAQIGKARPCEFTFYCEAELVNGNREDSPIPNLGVERTASLESLREKDGVPGFGTRDLLATRRGFCPTMGVGDDQHRTRDGLGVPPLRRDFGYGALSPLLALRDEPADHPDRYLEQQRQETHRKEAEHLRAADRGRQLLDRILH